MHGLIEIELTIQPVPHVCKLGPFTDWPHNARPLTLQRRQNVHHMSSL